jgi:hypothetical protein
MKDIIDVLGGLQSTPVPNILVVAGIILILLSFVGKFGAIIVLPSERQRLVGISGALFLLAGISLFLIANSKPDTPLLHPTVTFQPPPAKGDIYAVINKTTDESVALSLEWGTWKERRQIDLSNYDGLVLHLKHIDDDSFALKITTNGNVVKDPYQGEVPREWDNEKYKKVSL